MGLSASSGLDFRERNGAEDGKYSTEKALILQYPFVCVESHIVILVFVHKGVEVGRRYASI